MWLIIVVEYSRLICVYVEYNRFIILSSCCHVVDYYN